MKAAATALQTSKEWLVQKLFDRVRSGEVMNQGTASKPDYARVFNRLSHMIALSDDGKLKSTVDDAVLNALATDCSNSHVTCVADILKLVQVCYGISLAEHLVQSSLDRLLSRGSLLRDRNSKTLTVSPKVLAEIQARIDGARALEEEVRTQWLASLGYVGASAEADELWRCLRSYMAKAFERHGVETVTLLVPDLLTSRRDTKQLSVYLEESIEAECNSVSHDVAFSGVQRFFRESTASRTRYVAQLLDATFAYFALSVDRATSAYLKSRISPLTLLLDTNFIFGILGLHSHHLSEVSRELIDLVQTNKLPFRLVYHEVTLQEIERTIEGISERLRGRRWTQAASRAAVRTGVLSGIETRYHEMNANDGPITPEDFLRRYTYLEAELRQYGFAVYRRGEPRKDLDDERYRLIADYGEYIKDHRPRGPKKYEALNHDMTVWQTVSQLRTNGHSLLSVGAFFLTTDYHLFCFDWYTKRKPNTLGLVVLPNQFLQLLRPFVASDSDADHRFVETFAIPALRAVSTDYSLTASRVLSVLNSFAGLSEETAVNILANEVLIRRLSDIDPDSEEFTDSIENEVVRQNEYLLDQQKRLQIAAEQSLRQAEESQMLLAKQQEETEKERYDRLRSEAEVESAKREAEEIRRQAASSEAISARLLSDYSAKLSQVEAERQANLRKTGRIVSLLSASFLAVLTFLVARTLAWS